MVNKGKRRITKIKSSTPLLLIEETGKDVEDANDVEEFEKEEEPMKKKGKVIITKLAKPSVVVFNRRSRKKVDREGGDIIFNEPLSTFQDRLKELQEGVGITNFKELKYDTITKEEQK